MSAATEIRRAEVSQGLFYINQTALGRLQQNAQSACHSETLFTRDANAELFVDEQQVGALSLCQLNCLALSRIELRQLRLDGFGHVLHDEP